MAVTRGQGNPHWTREEVILALELYQSLGGEIPGPTDERIVELSVELRALPYHVRASKNKTFRNPAGVAFKLQNIRQVATGHGLPNTSRMDREVWAEFGESPGATSEAAALIRRGLEIVRQEEAAEDDSEFAEGRAVTEAHKRIERRKGLRGKLLKSRRAKNRLCCDVCGRREEYLDESVRDSIFEVHHLIPLSDSGETKTKLSDLALLCANCHRLIHRLISVRKRWVSPAEAKDVLDGNGV